MMATHLQLVLRSRICGSIHPLPHTPSWPSAWLVRHRDNFTSAHAISLLADFSTLKMEAIISSKTSVHTRSTRRHIPEDGIIHSHRRENLKSYIRFFFIELEHSSPCSQKPPIRRYGSVYTSHSFSLWHHFIVTSSFTSVSPDFPLLYSLHRTSV
jgi:hypothetical protein